MPEFVVMIRRMVAPLLIALTMIGSVAAQDLLVPQGREDRPSGLVDAPVTLIEYSSPTCSHCVAYHRDVAPVIKSRYIDSGKVRLLFRPFARNAIDAAIFMLAEAQPAADYARVLDAFYQRHEEIVGAADVRGKLMEIAATLGIDKAAFEAVVANEAAFTPLQALARQAVEQFGLESTPTFFVNGERLVGSVSVDQMGAAIDAKLTETGH